MLQQVRAGVITQNLFALQQYKFLRPDGKSVFLWGSVIDMGVTDRKRPQFLATQLANQALSFGTSRRPEAPVKEEARAHFATYVESSGGDVSDDAWRRRSDVEPALGQHRATGGRPLPAVVRLRQRTLSFHGGVQPPPHQQPAHNVCRRQLTRRRSAGANSLTSAQPGDTNEDSAKIGITAHTLPDFQASSALSLPANSMTVLRWVTPLAPAVVRPPHAR